MLFVWACVDTHRRNRGVDKRAAQMAASMVSQMHYQSGPPGPAQPGFPTGHYPQPYLQGQAQSPPQQYHQQAPPQMYQPYGGPAQAGPAPPGIGPAYTQHTSYHDAGSANKYPAHHEQNRDASSLGPTAHGDTRSPALSSVSPVGHHDENQPEVAHHQPKTY